MSPPSVLPNKITEKMHHNIMSKVKSEDEAGLETSP
jgi:hypothetical protein